MNSIFNLNCTGCPQLLELSVAFKFMTNRFDCTAHPDILSTVSTSPIIDFFLYLFADWDLLNLLELSQELILLLWSIPDTFFDPRNRRKRDLKDLLFFFAKPTECPPVANSPPRKFGQLFFGRHSGPNWSDFEQHFLLQQYKSIQRKSSLIYCH